MPLLIFSCQPAVIPRYEIELTYFWILLLLFLTLPAHTRLCNLKLLTVLVFQPTAFAHATPVYMLSTDSLLIQSKQMSVVRLE